jgi:hypothetical protein
MIFLLDFWRQLFGGNCSYYDNQSLPPDTASNVTKVDDIHHQSNLSDFLKLRQPRTFYWKQPGLQSGQQRSIMIHAPN